MQVGRFALLALFFLVIGTTLLVSRFWPHSKAALNDMPAFIFTIVMIFLFSEQMAARGKGAARRAGLVCPSCQQAFTIPDTKLVLTTQNCPYCGQRVFEP